MTSRRRVASGIALLLLLSVGAAIRASAPTWTFAGDLTVVRPIGGLAFLLPDGTLLLVGGLSTGTATDLTTDGFNPATGRWSPGPSSQFAHPGAPASVRLADGRILVTGGRYGFDVTRSQHTVTPLLDGRVLVVGGGTATGLTTTAELYDPATQTFSLTGPTSHTSPDSPSTPNKGLL